MATQAIPTFDQFVASQRQNRIPTFDEFVAQQKPKTTPEPSFLDKAKSAANGALDWLYGSTPPADRKRNEMAGKPTAAEQAQFPPEDMGAYQEAMQVPLRGVEKIGEGIEKVTRPPSFKALPSDRTQTLQREQPQQPPIPYLPYSRRKAASEESDRKLNASGLSDILEGGMEAGSVYLPEAIAAAPVATPLAIGGGMIAQEGTRAGLEKLGVDPEYARLGGNVAGIVGGGIVGHKVGGLVEDYKGLSDILKNYETPTGEGEFSKPQPGRYSGEAFLRNRIQPKQRAKDSARVFEQNPPTEAETNLNAAEAQNAARTEQEGTYQDLFDKISARETENAKRAETLAQPKAEVPSEGPSDRVQRVAAQRDELAKQNGYTGWDDQSIPAGDRIAIDSLISEGHLSAPAQPKSADLPVVPESDATIQEQMGQLQQGQRKVVMVPKGTTMPNVPRKSGLKIIYDGEARYIFDPQAITPREIRSAAKRNALPDILGAKQGGMGAPDKTALQSEPVAVVGKNPEGVTTQGTLTDQPNLERTIEQTEKVTPEGGNVEVVPPGQEISERVADQQQPEPAAPAAAPQQVGQPIDQSAIRAVNPHDIIADPQRFQFKSDAIGKGGTTDKLRDVTEWNPRVAGIISVWTDPANGKTYVINGHHRLELAQRLNVPEINVQHIDAPDAITARGIGALDNLMEGNGSAVDAAKVFRDLNLSDADLQQRGVALKGPLARDAMGLRDLTPEVFDAVARGDFESKNAAMIGRMLKNPADQIAAAKMVEKAEASGKNLKPSEVERMIRLTAGAERGFSEQETLFGTNTIEENYAGEQAQLADWVAGQISKEKRLFAAVGNQGAAERLGRKGNVIKAEDNAAVAHQAAQAAELFEKMYDKGGPVNDVIRTGAKRIAQGENANAVRREVYDAVHKAIADIFGGHEPYGGKPGGNLEASQNQHGQNPSGLDRPELSGNPGEPNPPSLAELEAAGQTGLFGVSPERSKSEAGFLNLGGRKPAAPRTPAEQIVEKNVADREAARKGQSKSLTQRIEDTLRTIKAGVVDSTSPITDRLLEAQRKHGYEVLPEQNIDLQIDRVLRSSSIARQFIEDQGLENVIRKVDDVEKFGEYLIAKQAQNLEAKGIKTGRNLADDAVIIREFENRPAYARQPQQPQPPTYKQLADEIRKYNHKLLDYGVESGLIHPDLATKLKQMYPDYVPMQRIFADEELGAGAWNSPAVASLSKQSLVQRIEGSERKVENPLASLIAKTFDAFAQGERNKAGRMLADYRELPGWKGVIREVGPGEHPDANTTFSYLDQGKKRTFVTTKDIATAAKSLDVQQLNALIRAGAVFTRMLKLGAVGVNIPFMASNVAADIVATSVTAGGKSMGIKALAKGLKSAALHDSMFKEMHREGTGFTSFDQLRTEPREGIEDLRNGKFSASRPIKSAGNLFRAAEDLVGRSEEFSRSRLYAAAYDKAIKAGRTPEHARMLAAHEANFKLPNYVRSGNWMRSLNALVPFLNARMQGGRSLVRSAQENPLSTGIRFGLYVFLPAAAMTAWNLSDEKRKQAFSDIAEYEKRGNFIWVPPDPQKDEKGSYSVIKVKMAPDIGRLVHPLQRAMEQWAGLHPVEFKEVAQDLIGSISPISPDSSMISEAMPQVFKAPAQSIANYDYFRDRPIVPDKLKRLPPEDQVYPWTSGTARKIGGATGTSPIKVEQFIKDVMAGVGSQALWASDKLLSATGNIPSDQVGGQDPLSGTEARFNSARGGEIENRQRTNKEDLRLRVIRGLRAGQDMRSELSDAIRSKLITPADAKAMREEARATPEVRQRNQEIKERKAALRRR